MSAIKSFNGLAAGSIKSYNGLAINSLKSINGIGAPYWVQLLNAAATIIPITILYGDESFLALVTGEISGIADGWVGGAAAHNASQAIAARRPHWNAATGLMEFDKTNTEWMSLDFSSSEASGDWTFPVGTDIKNATGVNESLADFQTGRLILRVLSNVANNVGYYDGAARSWGAAALGAQGFIYEMKAGVATASGRRDGVQIGSKLNLSARALGGANCFLGGQGGVGNYTDLHLKYFSIYDGVDTTDTASIETINATMKAAGLFG